MKILCDRLDLPRAECDLLVVNQFEGVRSYGGGTGAVDKALDGFMQKLAREEKFKGEFGEALVFRTYGKIPANKVMLLGLGDRKEFGLEKVRQLGGITVKKARDLGAKQVVTILHGAGIGRLNAADCARALSEGLMLSNYRFLKYKKSEAEKLGKKDIEEIIIAEIDNSKMRLIRKGIELGIHEAHGVMYARDLVNEPGFQLLPKDLAEKAREIARGKANIKLKLFDRPTLEKMGAGGLLGVAMGSAHEPYLIHLKYTPKTGRPKKKATAKNRAAECESQSGNQPFGQ